MVRSKATLIAGAVMFMIGAVTFIIALFTSFGDKTVLGAVGVVFVSLSMFVIIAGTYFKTVENRERSSKK